MNCENFCGSLIQPHTIESVILGESRYKLDIKMDRIEKVMLTSN